MTKQIKIKSDIGRKADKKRLVGCLIIFAAALAVRLIFMCQASKSPTFFTPIIDSGHYHALAKALAEGNFKGPTFFWQPIFYPLFFLSRVYLVTGDSIICAKLLQSILGSVLCVLVYLLGRRIFDDRTGLVAGLMVVFYGPVMYFDSELVATGWAAFWSVVLILLFLIAAEKPGLFVFFALGICAGLSFITRPTFLAFFAVAVFWLTLTLRKASLKFKAVAARNALILLGFMLVIAPVSLMAFYIKGNFNPLPRFGPVNLYIGNNPDSWRMNPRPGREWDILYTLPSQYGYTEEDAGNFFLGRVRSYIASEPLDFTKALARKTVRFFSSREIPRTYDMYVARQYSALFSVLTWKTHNFGFPFGLLLPLTVLGIIYCRRQIPAPVILFLVFYPLSVILIFNAARYRVPVIPIMAVPAAAGFWSLAGSIRTKRLLHTSIMTAVIILTVVLSSVAGPFPAEQYNYAAEMHYWVGSANKYEKKSEKALFHLSEAIRLNPDYPDAHRLFGQLLYEQGRPRAALEHLEKALELDPRLKVTHYYIGAVLLEMGKADEAISHLRKALDYANSTWNLILLDKTRRKLKEAVSAVPENRSAESGGRE